MLLVAASILSLVVLITNFILAIVASAKHGHNTPLVVFFEGKYARVNTRDMYFQVGTCILSDLLLDASTLCMQLLAAPTRQQVDAAHRCGKWLDVEVSSWRNLRHISGHRQVLWWCLGTTSIPLHLM